MNMYNNFVEVELTDEIKSIAKEHAILRTESIVRQFTGRAPSSYLERNYYGCLAELALKKFFQLNIVLDDNYAEKKVDKGDIFYNNLSYDIKCTVRPKYSYDKLYNGSIKPWEPYGMVDYTAKHIHHLPKYDGGIIFSTIGIPNDARKTMKQGIIREEIYNINSLLIIGYLKQNEIMENKDGSVREAVFRSPLNPSTGKSETRGYNSPNYIFHHTELRSVKELKNEV